MPSTDRPSQRFQNSVDNFRLHKKAEMEKQKMQGSRRSSRRAVRWRKPLGETSSLGGFDRFEDRKAVSPAPRRDRGLAHCLVFVVLRRFRTVSRQARNRSSVASYAMLCRVDGTRLRLLRSLPVVASEFRLGIVCSIYGKVFPNCTATPQTALKVSWTRERSAGVMVQMTRQERWAIVKGG